MQKGYKHFGKHNFSAAADCWLEAWEWIKKNADSKINSIQELDRKFSLNYLLLNWSQEFCLCIRSAAAENEEYLKKLIRYVDEYYELFPKTEESILIMHRRYAAEVCFELGRIEEGEARFRQAISEYPDEPWLYIGWGDMYSVFRPNEKIPHDPDRARQLYEKARPLVKEYEEEELKNRFAQLDKCHECNN